MDCGRKKELKEQYENRRPEMGVVGWRSGERLWVAVSKDTRASYNRSLFQLNLGSWPNQEMQRAYTDDPRSFSWSVLEKLDYEELSDVDDDDLQLLLMQCMEEHPEAESMNP